jgi:hypothetical protein
MHACRRRQQRSSAFAYGSTLDLALDFKCT